MSPQITKSCLFTDKPDRGAGFSSTRTIKLINLSRFLHFYLYYRDSLIIHVKPDRARNSNFYRIPRQLYNSQVRLYRDTRNAQKICTRMAKTAPCFAHYDLRDRVSSAEGSYLPVSDRSAPFTYFIAGPLCPIYLGSHKKLIDSTY